ncbi:MAG: M48 family metalloprotease [Deltaproteobacteria bacterium]|nr:M48 family metalloprotease [Deltaproteobacteria bacterium]
MKSLKKIPRYFKLLGLLCLIISLVVFQPPNLFALNQNEEIELGQKVHSQLAAQSVFFDDPIVNEYFQKICQRLMKAVGKQPYPYTFTIVNSNFLNAFAVPGGFIYLHTETINSLENEGQLAAILAHEIAHITSRHFARRSDSSRSNTLLSLAGLLVGIALSTSGGSGGQNTAALGQAILMGTTGASIQAMLANSRADETEADTKGRNYMIKAGYNPRDMYGAFKIMNEQSYPFTANIPGYLSTHPGLAARLASSFADQQAAPAAPFDASYQHIKDRVLALTAQPNRAMTLFAKRLAENPNDDSALHALGLIAMREMSYSQAEDFFKKALSLSATSAEYLSDFGELDLKRRRPEEAAAHFQAARKNGLTNMQTAVGLARSYELIGRIKDASDLYEQIAKSPSAAYPVALELAGRFFGQHGQLAKGHFLLATFFEATGKPKDAIFHCQAAVKDPQGYNYRKKCEQKERDLTALNED